MTNSQILNQIEVLRSQYSAADEKRKTEIMTEQGKLKASLKRCSQCSMVLGDVETGFCSEECRDKYWDTGRKSTIVRSKQELLNRMDELKKSWYSKEDKTFNEAKKIFV